MAVIYCVDTEKEVTPLMVRDALIKCFTAAHSEVMDQMLEYGNMSEDELKRMKQLNVELLVKKTFSDTGGDFQNPTKESLMKVMEELKKLAANFRQPEIIARHAGEIMTLMEKLK